MEWLYIIIKQLTFLLVTIIIKKITIKNPRNIINRHSIIYLRKNKTPTQIAKLFNKAGRYWLGDKVLK